jgi:sec-independent protein translocase protein TatB
VLDNLGGWEILALILIALFIIGPERLPKAISDGLGMLRKVRSMARNATSDLSRELGTNIELEDLHPKTFLRKHLLSEAEEEALRKPFQEVFRDVKSTAETLNSEAADVLSMDKGAASPNGGAGGTGTSAITPPPVGQAVKPSYGYDDAT